MDEGDEGCRPICRSKMHHCVGLLNAVNPLKGKFLSTCKCNSQLMKTHWQIKHPQPSTKAKLIVYRRITPRNRVCDDSSDAIERYVVVGCLKEVINRQQVVLDN